MEEAVQPPDIEELMQIEAEHMELKSGPRYRKIQWINPSWGRSKWKPGRKSDRDRINRVRSWDKRYNLVLDIPEIFDRILDYVDWEDPGGAVKFCRAIETLGSTMLLEYNFLMNKKEKRFTKRVSVGAFRVKLLKGTHCVDCLKPVRFTDERIDSFGMGTRCWKCCQQKFGGLVTEKHARLMMDNWICKLEVENLVARCKIITGCQLHNHSMALRRTRHSGSQFFIKRDVKGAIRKHKLLKETQHSDNLDRIQSFISEHKYTAK